MSDFEKQNDEAFGMIRQNRECHPGGEPVILMNASQARQLVAQANRKEAMDASFAQIQDDPLTVRRDNLIRAGKTILKALPALIFMTGASEGLMNLHFAAGLSIPCLLCAVGYWLWGDGHA